MKTHLQRWGNSLGMRSPRVLAQQSGLADGAPVGMDMQDGALVIRRKKGTLVELLAAIYPDRLHEKISFGEQVGREES